MKNRIWVFSDQKFWQMSKFLMGEDFLNKESFNKVINVNNKILFRIEIKLKNKLIHTQ
jgi:hypothetical protein